MEMEEQFEDLISREFLENALERKVDEYVVTIGSKPGDNYTSTMYAIEVHFSESEADPNNDPSENTEDTVYLVSKCYPNLSVRQELLIENNLFHTELSFYKDYVPALMQMQQDLQLENTIQPNFPTLVAGHAINFCEEKADAGKVYKPFDNYIMMVDVRKTFGHKLAGRFNSFDWAHASLVVDAVAKIHALALAYKQNNNISDVNSIFPTINNESLIRGMNEFMKALLRTNAVVPYDIVKSEFGEESPITTGMKKLCDLGELFLTMSYEGQNTYEYEKYMRITPEDPEGDNDETPWKILIHGDCWSNNMLFRYDEDTGEPEDVILVDLQCIREACPTTDLAYMVYISTDSEFRKQHLEQLLDLYTERIIHYCQMLETEPFPGFCARELKRRFHQSKIYGFCAAIYALPIMLTEIADSNDLEAVEDGKNATDVFTSFCSAPDKDSPLKHRFVGISQDMYADGII